MTPRLSSVFWAQVLWCGVVEFLWVLDRTELGQPWFDLGWLADGSNCCWRRFWGVTQAFLPVELNEGADPAVTDRNVCVTTEHIGVSGSASVSLVATFLCKRHARHRCN